MAQSAAPFFSVVIPVFNRADALKVALKSVLTQSDQDFEIVVVDDGSEDDPKSIIDAVADPASAIAARRTRAAAPRATRASISRAAGSSPFSIPTINFSRTT